MLSPETMPTRPERAARRPDEDAAPGAAHRACRQVEIEVAAALAVAVDDIRRPTRRGPRAAAARQFAMYLAHTLLGQSYHAVGALFGRDRTTASYACHRIEDRRDNPEVDALLTELERRCAPIVRRLSGPEARQ